MSTLAKMLQDVVEDARSSVPKPGYVNDIVLAVPRLRDALSQYQKPTLKIGDIVTPSLDSSYLTPAKGEFGIVSEILTQTPTNDETSIYRVSDIVIMAAAQSQAGTAIVPISVDSRFFDKVDVEAEIIRANQEVQAKADAVPFTDDDAIALVRDETTGTVVGSNPPTTPYPSDQDEGGAP